jgi:hypothetical protein
VREIEAEDTDLAVLFAAVAIGVSACIGMVLLLG